MEASLPEPLEAGVLVFPLLPQAARDRAMLSASARDKSFFNFIFNFSFTLVSPCRKRAASLYAVHNMLIFSPMQEKLRER